MLAPALVAVQTTPTPSPTPTTNVSVVIGLDVFVRGGPGRQYIPVGRLVLGDQVTPLSRNTDADWVLITYNAGFGWVRRDLVSWVENIDLLPVMSEANLTPSPGVPVTPERTFVLLPTATPVGNWVRVTDAPSGYVRAGPGRTYLRLGQLTSGDTVEPVGRNADTTWIMIRFLDGFGWIRRDLVRWVDDLENLPEVALDNLTPTATFTPTDTSTATFTPTDTSTPTLTPTVMPSPTETDTLTPSLTSTSTHTPSATPTDTATQTSTPTASATPTVILTNTPTDTAVPTATDTVTMTATSSLTPTVVPTEIPLATETSAALALVPTDTFILSSTNTLTNTPMATNTPRPTLTYTETPSPTYTLTATRVPPTNTPRSSDTPAISLTPTAGQPLATFAQGVNIRSGPGVEFQPPIGSIPAGEVAEIVARTAAADWYKIRYQGIEGWVLGELVVVIGDLNRIPVEAAPPLPPTTTVTPTRIIPTATLSPQPPTATATPAPVAAAATNVPQTTPASESPAAGTRGLPLEAVVGGVALLLLLAYVVVYWRGLAAAERYRNGFVIQRCPACDRGELIVEMKQDRLLGIPRPRRTVRCTECRSVLREVGYRRWRYAVDPMENPALYKHYNGREIDDNTLLEIARQPHSPDTAPAQPRPPVMPPSFTDDQDH